MYKPFETIEQVEDFYCHSIYKNGVEYTVVGSNYSDDELQIQAVDNDGNEVSMSAVDWFQSATYMNHKFGIKVGK